MRRLIGLILLLALVIGAGWFVSNSQQQAQNAGETEVFEPARSADESVPPPDVAEAPPAAVPAPKAPPVGPDVATARPQSPSQPEAPAAEPVTPPPAAESTAPPTTPETATSEEPPTEEPPATPPAADAVPTFDVVRVEPSGDTVIAGLAAPESKVEVLDGAEPVATAEANERGEWALVLDKPLPPGTHDLAIRTTTPDKSVVTLSDQRVAVAVPDGKGEAPLVVLNAPKAPSKVMQVPAEPEIAAAPEAPPPPAEPPASATAPQPSTSPEPATPPEPSAPPAPGETDIASAPPAPAEPKPEPKVPTTVPAPSETPMASTPPAPEVTPAPEAPPPPAAAAPPSPETATKAEPAPSTGEPAPSTAPAPQQPEIAAAPPQPEPPAPPAPEPASEPPAAEAPEPAAPKPPEPKVGVAAVEAESNGALYIAGTATRPDPVRVYVDDELVGEATPTEGGTWLIETNRELAPGDYKIRADQVEEGSGKVIVRAEVPFEREIEVAVLKQSNESADPGGAEVEGSVAGPMSVIIKRGDNLWRISREMYGHGVRYSTIYRANKDQIRDPDRIYPGQVFVLPQGDTAWQN